MTIPEMIADVQRSLGVTVDGKAGPETWSAIWRKLTGKAAAPTPADISTVDPRSEKNIQTLHPKVRPLARSLVQAAKAQGITIKVTSALRTYEEQNDLYAQGRTKPGNKVTNARGGFSSHNFGLAFDVTLFNGATPVWESPLYKVVGALGQSLGLEWGGSWKSFKDEPHFQLRPQWAGDMNESAMLAGLRDRKSAGKDAFA